MPIPVSETVDIDTLGTGTAVKTVLEAKYNEANAWAVWAATLLEQKLPQLAETVDMAGVTANLAKLQVILDGLEKYTFDKTFTYTKPTSPDYSDVPNYVQQTLGTILPIPAIRELDIPAMPSSTVTFIDEDFSDTLLDAIKAKLLHDVGTAGTGLGAAAEAALFERETNRTNLARQRAYAEVTEAMGNRGFDIPTGALSSKQSEQNTETGLRLADSSAMIMAESARLAVDWNKTVITSCTQLLALISQIFDNKLARRFDAAKTKVLTDLEGFKSAVAGVLAVADLNKTEISAVVAANDGTAKVFEIQNKGQLDPILAITEANKSKASSYVAAVQGAIADLNAQTLPEEFKLKGIDINAKIAGVMADVAGKEAQIALEAAAKTLTLSVSTIQATAQHLTQVIASALGSVNVSGALGYSGQFSTTSSETNNLNLERTDDIARTQEMY